MSLSIVELGAYASAALLSATKLLNTAKPLWDKLPRVVSVALPVVVACLPIIAEKAGLVQSPVDVATLVVTAAALLVPGIAEAEKTA